MCHIFFTGHKNIETLLFKSWGHHTKSRYVSGSNNGVIKLVQTTDKNKINYANKTVLNIIPLICNMPLKMIAATLKILNMMRKIKEN